MTDAYTIRTYKIKSINVFLYGSDKHKTDSISRRRRRDATFNGISRSTLSNTDRAKIKALGTPSTIQNDDIQFHRINR